MAFIPKTKPSDAPIYPNTYYVSTTKGGLNECIVINQQTGWTMPNCVGYTWGRWYEITGQRPTLSKADANYWYDYNDGYERSQVPHLGDVICWTGGDFSGLGHVAIVEAIDGDIITTSNSAYGSTEFFIEHLKISEGYKRPYGGYTFKGFIVNPNITPPTPYKPKKLPIIYYSKLL